MSNTPSTSTAEPTPDPAGADPAGADPAGADPAGADPAGADPADPAGADPAEAAVDADQPPPETPPESPQSGHGTASASTVSVASDLGDPNSLESSGYDSWESLGSLSSEWEWEWDEDFFEY
ncbi:opioid growth factor receptor [Bicyclus anynana]|uniref:Opioid growth factor receptor n=1 Tax=Bicyclus anynana TaxID=110368 RepID=A0A6J1P610_BICAN|nr:opioid growth factor receptor [Bicyclus anynana]